MCRARADNRFRVLPDASPLFAVLADRSERRNPLKGETYGVVGDVVVQRVQGAPKGAEPCFACAIDVSH